MISSLFTTGTRAFTTRAAAVFSKQQLQKQQHGIAIPSNRCTGGMARFMSTEQQDKSIVDVCTEKIRLALETENVIVKGAFDDPNGSHISVEVVSSKFEGKRPVQRQQLVYKAIWEELQGPVHAVDSMVCKTPDES